MIGPYLVAVHIIILLCMYTTLPRPRPPDEDSPIEMAASNRLLEATAQNVGRSRY